MGRTPLSGWPLMFVLRRAGLRASAFTYFVSSEDFDSIADRLARNVTDIASRGDYVVIGHSLGGVLLRAAISRLDAAVPRPRHLFLLGSPVRQARLARRLARNPVYRRLTGDCGQLLASEMRMTEVHTAAGSVIGVAGVVRAAQRLRAFSGEPSDGVVALSEVTADWLTEQVQVPVVHAFLPWSPTVARVILDRITD